MSGRKRQIDAIAHKTKAEIHEVFRVVRTHPRRDGAHQVFARGAGALRETPRNCRELRMVKIGAGNSHRRREIGNSNPVNRNVLNREQIIERIDGRFLLDQGHNHHVASHLLEEILAVVETVAGCAHRRADATHAIWRMHGRGNCALKISAVVDMRHDHTVGAGVESLHDQDRIIVGHAHQWRNTGRIGGARQMLDLGKIPGRMFHVQRNPFQAGMSENFHESRTAGKALHAEQWPGLRELLAKIHVHRRLSRFRSFY